MVDILVLNELCICVQPINEISASHGENFAFNPNNAYANVEFLYCI